MRLLLDEAARHVAVGELERKQVLEATIDIVERIRQEISRVGFWKNDHAREVLTRQIVRDLDRLRSVIPAAGHRDLAQRLVALAKENHEYLKR